MALDWSVHQAPGYLASKMYADSAEQVGQLAGAATVGLGAAAFTRPELSGKSIQEGIRGTGRSYYKDNVDKSLYGTYDEWVQSDNAGQYLKLAESGANMTMKDGEYMIQKPDGSWSNMGDANQVLEEGQFYDPYAVSGGAHDLNPWESHMREKMMGAKWVGGDYEYKAPKTALGALFSKERFRPRANLYRDAAYQGMSEKGQETWGDLNERDLKGQGLGWYPGVGIGGALGAVFNKKKGQSTQHQNDDKKNVNQNNNQDDLSTVNWQDPNGPWGTGFKYGIQKGYSSDKKQQVQDLMTERGITPESWKLAIDTYGKNNPYLNMTGNQLIDMLEKDNLTIDPQTGELIPVAPNLQAKAKAGGAMNAQQMDDKYGVGFSKTPPPFRMAYKNSVGKRMPIEFKNDPEVVKFLQSNGINPDNVIWYQK